MEAQVADRGELVRVSEMGKARPKDSLWGSHSWDPRFVNNNKSVLKGQETTERVIERSLGALGTPQEARYIRPIRPVIATCCTGRGSQALYYAWEAIIRNRGGATANVNLWLNRRSPWCDVWSGLPYEGKLVVQNWGLQRLAIRKPSWARQSTVRCLLDGCLVQPPWFGNRILLDGLKGNEWIELQVLLTVERAGYRLVDLNHREKLGESYTCEFKGHTGAYRGRLEPAMVSYFPPGTHARQQRTAKANFRLHPPGKAGAMVCALRGKKRISKLVKKKPQWLVKF